MFQTFLFRPKKLKGAPSYNIVKLQSTLGSLKAKSFLGLFEYLQYYSIKFNLTTQFFKLKKNLGYQNIKTLFYALKLRKRYIYRRKIMQNLTPKAKFRRLRRKYKYRFLKFRKRRQRKSKRFFRKQKFILRRLRRFFKKKNFRLRRRKYKLRNKFFLRLYKNNLKKVSTSSLLSGTLVKVNSFTKAYNLEAFKVKSPSVLPTTHFSGTLSTAITASIFCRNLISFFFAFSNSFFFKKPCFCVD
jgi:hypothetical protein